MKKKWNFCALLLILALLLSIAAGCGSQTGDPSVPAAEENGSIQEPTEEAVAAAEAAPVPEEPASSENEEAEPPAEEPVEIAEMTLPLTEEPVTLTWFTSLLSANDRVYLPTMADNEALKHLEEITGVMIEPVECDSETYSEKLNIMIASGDCTDILYNAVDFVANPDQMVRDEVFLDLTEPILFPKRCPTHTWKT